MNFDCKDWPVHTRVEAEAEKLHKYFNGKKCKNGHLTLRFVKTGACWACVKEQAKRNRLQKYLPRPEIRENTDFDPTNYPIKTGVQARAEGLHKYFNGRKCANGHIDLRYSNTGACVACVRQQARRNKERRQLDKRGWKWVEYYVHRADEEALKKFVNDLIQYRLLSGEEF